MVILKDQRKTIEISLPSFKDSKVTLYDGMLFGDWAELDKEKSEIGKGLLSLKLLIKEWNFTDEKGEVLKVTIDNLKLFPMKDLTLMLEKISDFFTKLNTENEKPSKE